MLSFLNCDNNIPPREDLPNRIVNVDNLGVHCSNFNTYLLHLQHVHERSLCIKFSLVLKRGEKREYFLLWDFTVFLIHTKQVHIILQIIIYHLYFSTYVNIEVVKMNEIVDCSLAKYIFDRTAKIKTTK